MTDALHFLKDKPASESTGCSERFTHAGALGMTGRGKNGITVEFSGILSDKGKFFDIKIDGSARYILKGKKINL